MHDIDVQVLGVSGRTTRNGKTVYEVSLGDGNKYTTFDAPLATKSHALSGQMCSARVDVSQSQDGRYTNYNLKDIAPQGQLSALALPAGTPVGIPIAGQSAPSGGGIPMQTAGGGGQDFQRKRHPEESASIVRQSAYDAAFSFVGRLLDGSGPEAYEQGVELAKKLASELAAWGIGLQPAAPAPEPAPQTAEEVAQQVPGVQVGTEGIAPAAAGQTTVIPW